MVQTPTEKPKSKGQRVKSFTAYIPQLTGDAEKTTVQVYLNAQARFVIYIDDHINAVVSGHDDARGERQDDNGRGFYDHHRGYVSSPTFETTKAAAERLWKLFERILLEAGKSQVLLIRFAANRRGEGDHHGPTDRPARVSFAGNQTVMFSFSKLWRSGDQLYSQSGADQPLRFVKNVADVRGMGGHGNHRSEWYMVEWSQEREDFLREVDDALAVLIYRLSSFMGHGEGGGTLLDNLTQALATGGGFAALSAPKLES